MRAFFAPRLPAEIERAEREKVARQKPRLSLVGLDPRPDPSMFAWRSVADLIPIQPEQEQ